jgi:hypothetical protein
VRHLSPQYESSFLLKLLEEEAIPRHAEGFQNVTQPNNA